MKYYTKEINGKDYNFRMTSEDITTLEEKNKTNIQRYILEDASLSKAATLIRYLRHSSEPNFSNKDALGFIDELVDEGYTVDTIYYDIIFPACVTSGIIDEKQLKQIMEAITNQHNQEKTSDESQKQ